MNHYFLENDFVAVDLAGDGSRLTVSSKETSWRYDVSDFAMMGYSEMYTYDLSTHADLRVLEKPGELNLVFENIRYWVRFPENGFWKPKAGPDFKFDLSILLDQDEVVFRINRIENLNQKCENIDGEIVHLSFPYRPVRWMRSDRVNFVASFGGFGMMSRFPIQDSASRCTNNEPLPLYGAFNAEGGIGVRYSHSPFDQFTEYHYGGSGCYANTQFDFEPGFSEYGRELRLFFLKPGENYVQLAKKYRARMMQEGRFRSLREKIAVNPEVAQLAGTLLWKNNVFWQKQLPPGVERDYSPYVMDEEAGHNEGKVNNWTAYEVFDAARKMGFDRVLIPNIGWNCYGFDSGFPVRFPVNSQRGTEEEFRECVAYGRSISRDYILTVHDNYRDVYKNSPEFPLDELFYSEEGVAVKGGFWHGGRAYLLCPQKGINYARRDLPRIADITGRGCIYIDVLGCTPFRRCHHPAHPGSGEDDVRGRLTILGEAKRHFGAVITEGAPHDYAVSTADAGTFCAIKSPCAAEWNGVPVPLSQLVYHDSVYNHAADGLAGVTGRDFSNYLALYCLLPSELSQDHLRISKELRETYLAEMVSHEYIGDFIQKTVFSDGTEVVADFSGPNGSQGNFQIRRKGEPATC